MYSKLTPILFFLILLLAGCTVAPGAPSILTTPVPSPTSSPTSSPTPTATPEPTPTPDFRTWDWETRSFDSPDGLWTASVIWAVPISEGVVISDQYYTQLKVTADDGSAEWMLVNKWEPWGLGYTIPEPLQWSQDGSALYFTNRPVPDGCAPFVNGSDLQRASLEDGTVVEVVPSVGLVLALSPDEATLAYVSQDRLVLRDLINDAEQSLDLVTVGAGSPGRLVWAPDSSALALTLAANACGPGEERSHSVLRVDADDLTPSLLVEPDDRLLTTAAWPEEARVVLFDREGQQWALDPVTGELSAGGGATLPTPEVGDSGTDAEGTPTPTPDSSTSIARIITFTVATELPKPGPGDAVTVTWQGEGNSASLCLGYARLSAGCEEVELEGSNTYVLRTEDPVADHWIDFTLTVASLAGIDRQTLRVPIRCHYPWFQEGLSEWCANEPTMRVPAVGQFFEKGLLVRTDLNTAYVVFDEEGAPYRSYGLLPPPSPEQPTEEPEEGDVAPALLPLWSGDLPGTEDLETRLGQPTGLPTAYEIQVQCGLTPEEPLPCFVLAPDGRVFETRLVRAGGPGEDGTTTAAGTYRWTEEP